VEHYKYRVENILKAYLDNMLFIWKEQTKGNYVTFFSEDYPDSPPVFSEDFLRVRCFQRDFLLLNVSFARGFTCVVGYQVTMGNYSPNCISDLLLRFWA
jgi:hypothetical protein